MTLDGVREKNLQQLNLQQLLNPAISPVRSPVRQPAHMIQSPKVGSPASTVEARHPRTRRCQGRRMHFTPPRGEAWVGGGARH